MAFKKGQKFTAEHLANMKASFTPERRAHLAKMTKEYQARPEVKAAKSAWMKAYWKLNPKGSPDHKIPVHRGSVISAKLKRQWAEGKRKYIPTFKGKKHTPETLVKMKHWTDDRKELMKLVRKKRHRGLTPEELIRYNGLVKWK